MRIFSLIAATALCTAVISGCGGTTPNSDPAGFTPASDQNPLDGGVISSNGSDAEWDVENGELKTVVISGRNEGTIEFGDPSDGAVMPREIATDGGDSVFTVNRNAGEVTIQTEAPLGFGPVEFTGPLPDELAVTRDLFLPNARASNGGVPSALDEVGCDSIVSSVDTFCMGYLMNGDAAEQEVIDFAIEIVEEEIGSSLLNGFVTSTIGDYFELLDVFCDGFEDVTTDAAIDLCETLR